MEGMYIPIVIFINRFVLCVATVKKVFRTIYDSHDQIQLNTSVVQTLWQNS